MVEDPHYFFGLKANQLHEEMMKIASRYGRKNVFGILTNYLYWSICWLPGATLAEATDVRPFVKNRTSSTTSYLFNDIPTRI